MYAEQVTGEECHGDGLTRQGDVPSICLLSLAVLLLLRPTGGVGEEENR
jgi:hypothetical protein